MVNSHPLQVRVLSVAPSSPHTNMKNLLIYAILASTAVAQVPNDPGNSIAWSFVNSHQGGCPGSLGLPTMPNRTAVDVLTVPLSNLKPAQPVICTMAMGSPPGPACIQALNDVVFFTWADSAGCATMQFLLPVSASSLLMPPGTNYFGILQIISFSSAFDYCASPAYAIYGTP